MLTDFVTELSFKRKDTSMLIHGYTYNTRHDKIMPVGYRAVNSTERVKIHRAKRYYNELLARGMDENQARQLTIVIYGLKTDVEV